MTMHRERAPRFTLRRDLPVDRQVAAYVKALIGLGTLPPGSPLPSAPALADELGVQRADVRRALALLRSRGFVESAGRGIRVAAGAPDVAVDLAARLRGIVAEARTAGLPPAEIRKLFAHVLRRAL